MADRNGHDMLTDYPKVKTWQQSLLVTGIPQKSEPENFVTRFADFYLAERTWLRRGANLNEALATTPAEQSGGCRG